MDKSTVIDLKELPSDILKKIPFSIKTKQKEYKLEELPLEYQYLIEKYYDNKLPTITYEDTLDFKFDISKYSDLSVFTNTTDLLKNYLQNYLMTRLKSYPFDPEFGCALKDQLMMLDTSLRQTYVANELHMVAAVLSSDLSLPIDIINFNIEHNTGSAASEYICVIQLKVNDDLMTMSLSSIKD